MLSGSERSHFPGEPLPEGEEVRVWEVLAVWLTEKNASRWGVFEGLASGCQEA